jgi:hypothetical protein
MCIAVEQLGVEAAIHCQCSSCSLAAMCCILTAAQLTAAQLIPGGSVLLLHTYSCCAHTHLQLQGDAAHWAALDALHQVLQNRNSVQSTQNHSHADTHVIVSVSVPRSAS